jgi:tetratricopeptide (TPR) repeat protein
MSPKRRRGTEGSTPDCRRGRTARVWHQSVRNAADAADRADAELVEIESLCWQGKPAQTLAAAEAFIAAHAGDAPSPRSKRANAWASIYAGDALHKLGRYQEALVYFRSVLDAHAGEPETWLGKNMLPTLYWRIWYTSRKAGASKAQLVPFSVRELCRHKSC